MRVAVVTGICVERDAISAAAVDQAEVIAGIDGVEDVVLIAQHHDRTCQLPLATATSSWDLIRSPAIARADVVVFHWGIRYDLFNSLVLVANERRTIVHFHNVTPAAIVEEADRSVVDESVRQMQLPAMAGSELWAVSEFNRATLTDWGYEPARVRVVPIAVERPARGVRASNPRPHVNLLTVGRLVRAKGVDTLVEAMRRVVDHTAGAVSLVLAGSAELSDRTFVDALQRSIDELGLEQHVRIRQDLDDAALAAEYRRADILVSPSLHEGLCVPVIEAYRAGCRVVATNAGNLPFLVQPPDPLVAAGDARALADAIVHVAREIQAGESHLPLGAESVIRAYSSTNVRSVLVDCLGAPVTG